MKRLIAGVLVVFVLALSACGNRDQPIDVVTPTPWGTPSPTAGTPSPADEARETYERYSAELTRVLQAGGADELTHVLLDTTDDDHRVTVLQLLRTVKEQRIRSVGDQSLRIVETVIESPERVRLYSCEDTTNTRWVDEMGSGVTLNSATIFETESVLSLVEDRWKVVDAVTTPLTGSSDLQRCQHDS